MPGSPNKRHSLSLQRYAVHEGLPCTKCGWVTLVAKAPARNSSWAFDALHWLNESTAGDLYNTFWRIIVVLNFLQCEAVCLWLGIFAYAFLLLLAGSELSCVLPCMEWSGFSKKALAWLSPWTTSPMNRVPAIHAPAITIHPKWWPKQFEVEILSSQWGKATCTQKAQVFSFGEKGRGEGGRDFFGTWCSQMYSRWFLHVPIKCPKAICAVPNLFPKFSIHSQ
jgi:hypothetical protein